MTQLHQVYKCSVCGNIVEVVRASSGELVCCNKPMVLMEENTVDAAQEKHVPVLKKVDGGIKVTVGSIAHPMQADHYIEWIEMRASGTIYRQYLQPEDRPEVIFTVNMGNVQARAYCNLHGLWKA